MGTPLYCDYTESTNEVCTLFSTQQALEKYWIRKVAFDLSAFW
jgi:hypothetical protein